MDSTPYSSLAHFPYYGYGNEKLKDVSETVHLFTGNIETGLKEGKILGCYKASEGSKGHKGHVLCLAVTSDGKFLVRETIWV